MARTKRRASTSKRISARKSARTSGGSDSPAADPDTPADLLRSTRQKRVFDQSRRYACDFLDCEYRFDSQAKLKRHTITHLDTSMRERVQCTEPGCHKTYSSADSMRSHVRKSHKNKDRFPCTEEGCTKRYSSAGDLKRHIRNHNEITLAYQCPRCGHKYSNWSNFNRHRRKAGTPCGALDRTLKEAKKGRLQAKKILVNRNNEQVDTHGHVVHDRFGPADPSRVRFRRTPATRKQLPRTADASPSPASSATASERSRSSSPTEDDGERSDVDVAAGDDDALMWALRQQHKAKVAQPQAQLPASLETLSNSEAIQRLIAEIEAKAPDAVAQASAAVALSRAATPLPPLAKTEGGGGVQPAAAIQKTEPAAAVGGHTFDDAMSLPPLDFSGADAKLASCFPFDTPKDLTAMTNGLTPQSQTSASLQPLSLNNGSLKYHPSPRTNFGLSALSLGTTSNTATGSSSSSGSSSSNSALGYFTQQPTPFFGSMGSLVPQTPQLGWPMPMTMPMPTMQISQTTAVVSTPPAFPSLALNGALPVNQQPTQSPRNGNSRPRLLQQPNSFSSVSSTLFPVQGAPTSTSALFSGQTGAVPSLRESSIAELAVASANDISSLNQRREQAARYLFQRQQQQQNSVGSAARPHSLALQQATTAAPLAGLSMSVGSFAKMGQRV